MTGPTRASGIPLVHRIPLTRLKLIIARVLYGIIKIIVRGDRHTITRKDITYSIDLSEGIDLSLFLFGTFQEHIPACPYLLLEKDAVILDIGANIGAMALRFAQRVPHGHVYAFEPARSAYRKLVHNIALNPQLCERITTANLFVSDKTQVMQATQQTYASWKINGINKNRHPIHGGIPQKISAEQSISIDDFCRDRSISRIDLIKIDTDGSELAVLKGGESIIQANRPYIIFELSLSLFTNSPLAFTDYYDFLCVSGYTLINIKNGAVITPANLHRQVPLRYTTDILAVPGNKSTVL